MAAAADYSIESIDIITITTPDYPIITAIAYGIQVTPVDSRYEHTGCVI